MLITLISLAAIIIKGLDFIYLFQTKEYRTDRILNFIQEEDFFSICYLRIPRLPAKSVRNLLIAIWLIIVIPALFFFLLSLPVFTAAAVLLIHPFLAFIITLSGVQITQLPSSLYRKRLVKKAAAKIRNSKAVFIGITGSYGKTTTKELLYQLLSQKFNVAKTEKNYNSEVGVAISVLKNLHRETQYFIAELGAYRTGEIKAACQLIRPKYGILTGIGNQHLSLFGSKQNLLAAKAELLEALPKDGIAYINMDIADRKFFAGKTKAKIVFYSLKNPVYKIKTNLTGRHILQNLLPCTALALHLGMTGQQIDSALANLRPVGRRLSEDSGINGSTVLDDSYNSNLQGFLLAIESARNKTGFGKKLIISRGLIELGEEKKQTYREIVNALNGSDLTMLTTDRLFKSLDSGNKIVLFKKESDLFEHLKKTADKNTLMVIEGRFEPKTLKQIMQKSE